MKTNLGCMCSKKYLYPLILVGKSLGWGIGALDRNWIWWGVDLGAREVGGLVVNKLIGC